MMQNNNDNKPLRKPEWIRIHLPKDNQMSKVNHLLKDNQHITVCEEANCPNRLECFSCGTATFMIMGEHCTRNCRFCNITQGKPKPLDNSEPEKLAETISKMNLNYVVITSVDRDDLKDGGANHYAECIHAIRKKNKNIKIEILTPDFKGCIQEALTAFSNNLPDVFNHNIETAPRLFKSICPGCSYENSLLLLNEFKKQFPNILTKSGIMLGLGETDEEIIEVLNDLRKNNVDMLTLGQYLQPSRNHIPVDRYITPEKFIEWKKIAQEIGFKYVASGPLVRSSYHAEEQQILL